jgi:predicted O-linked N-acetylglucosamine transferase (SPINDLY family)
VDPQHELQKALTFHRLGDLTNAEKSYRIILQAAPRNFDATYLLGLCFLQSGQFEKAEKQLGRAIKINPRAANAFNDRGNARLELSRSAEALADYDTAIGLDPTFAEAFNNRGNALSNLLRFDQAIECFDKAIAIKTDYARAYYNRGNSFRKLKNHKAALLSYESAIALEPNYIEAHNNRGNTLLDLHRPDDALSAYDKVISLTPFFAEAFSNRANALIELRRFSEAFQACEQALALNGNLSEGWLVRGDVLRNLRRYDESLIAYNQALKLNIQLADAWSGQAKTLHALKRNEEAAKAYAHLLQINPDYNFAKGHMAYEKMQACDWNGLAGLQQSICDDVHAGRKSAQPFGYQAFSYSAQDLKRCAQIFVQEEHPAASVPLCQHTRYDHRKVRVGYVSGEFRQQATSILITELFELHDKSRFELFAFDNGFDDNSELRQRINSAFDRIVDISRLGDAPALEIKQNEIDILVNLNGFFGEARTGVFSYRPAPIQVNYLGFPGTMGADYIDYIIADPSVIPPDQEDCYVEKIAYLPETYQVNDSKRRIADRQPMRLEAMLPEKGFVFCCFNNNYKITPEIFDIWMSVLTKVDCSVLWLVEDNADASRNLRNEAKRRNIDPERLVFASRVKLPEHLARHGLADLFLDTLPYNAHTTASDALWAGLPVLTCLGSTFPGRVAASLLKAIGMPELIARSLEDYELLAVQLAQKPEVLKGLRAKLTQSRMRYPLFDTKRLARHIEAAYVAMWERHQRGEPPVHFAVTPLARDSVF